MAAPGLERSMMTFRRSGSSGLVWEDRLFTESTMIKSSNKEEGPELRELRHSHSVGMIEQMRRSRSNRGSQPYRAIDRVPPAIDPPSPKLSGCGFFGIFRNSGAAKGSKPRRR